MKQVWKRSLSILLAIIMVVGMLPTAALAQGTGTTLYLNPGEWMKDGAWFAAYFYGNGETWVKMTDADGDWIYEVTAPADYTDVIFVRMGSGASEPNWDQKWNKTNDLTIPTDGNTCFTITDPWNESDTGDWGIYDGPAIIVAGSAGLCGTEWNPGDYSNQMTKTADGIYQKVYTNVAAGSYKLKVTNGTWGTSYPQNDYNLTVAEDGSTVTITFNAVTKEVTAQSEKVYNVIATVGAGGTVTGAGEYAEGETVTLTATANEGYTFVNWTENGAEVSTSATYTFTVTADRTLVANFAADLPTQEHPVCGDAECTAHGESLTWTAWTSTNSLPTETGSYYLTTDVTLADVAITNQNINLCLNGHTVNLNGKNIHIKGGTLTITDCGTTGTITGGRGVTINTNNCGGAVAVTNATFNLYGGTITGNSARFGGGVYLKSATFNMYGGTISNNTATISNSTGGGVNISEGAFNMYGGVIRDNNAKTKGGGVHLNSPGGKLNFYGGKVTGNTAGETGGGVYFDNGKLSLQGSVVITGNTGNGAANNL